MIGERYLTTTTQTDGGWKRITQHQYRVGNDWFVYAEDITERLPDGTTRHEMRWDDECSEALTYEDAV